MNVAATATASAPPLADRLSQDHSSMENCAPAIHFAMEIH